MNATIKAIKPQEPTLSAAEARLVAVFRRMNDEERATIALIANAWVDADSRSKAPSLRLVVGRPA